MGVNASNLPFSDVQRKQSRRRRASRPDAPCFDRSRKRRNPASRASNINYRDGMKMTSNTIRSAASKLTRTSGGSDTRRSRCRYIKKKTQKSPSWKKTQTTHRRRDRQPEIKMDPLRARACMQTPVRFVGVCNSMCVKACDGPRLARLRGEITRKRSITW